MSVNKSKPVTAMFETREAADLAVEHLVQKNGLDRTDVFVQAAGHQNSSGVDVSGVTLRQQMRTDAKMPSLAARSKSRQT